MALLRDDAVLTMPPFVAWFHGRDAIGTFLRANVFAGQARGRLRLVSTHANGQPAFATYQRDGSGVYRPAALHVLTVDVDAVAVIHDFLVFDDRLFSRFGLPSVG